MRIGSYKNEQYLGEYGGSKITLKVVFLSMDIFLSICLLSVSTIRFYLIKTDRK